MKQTYKEFTHEVDGRMAVMFQVPSRSTVYPNELHMRRAWEDGFSAKDYCIKYGREMNLRPYHEPKFNHRLLDRYIWYYLGQKKQPIVNGIMVEDGTQLSLRADQSENDQFNYHGPRKKANAQELALKHIREDLNTVRSVITAYYSIKDAGPRHVERVYANPYADYEPTPTPAAEAPPRPQPTVAESLNIMSPSENFYRGTTEPQSGTTEQRMRQAALEGRLRWVSMADVVSDIDLQANPRQTNDTPF